MGQGHLKQTPTGDSRRRLSSTIGKITTVVRLVIRCPGASPVPKCGCTRPPYCASNSVPRRSKDIRAPSQLPRMTSIERLRISGRCNLSDAALFCRAPRALSIFQKNRSSFRRIHEANLCHFTHPIDFEVVNKRSTRQAPRKCLRRYRTQ